MRPCTPTFKSDPDLHAYLVSHPALTAPPPHPCLATPGDRAPISYAALRAYFKSDPATSWGGYVAGCLLVLARERGVAFPDGISILICSDVPEGARPALPATR